MKKLASFLFLTFTFLSAFSQIQYAVKIESGYAPFQYNTVDVDPGPNWKGYYLDDQNGIDINVINGIMFRDRLYAGVGIGYWNFEGVNGITVFADIDYFILKTRLSPIINFKFGHNHLWNQYEGGTSTAMTELNVGLQLRLTEKISVYLKGGYLFMQQSLLIPVRIGINI